MITSQIVITLGFTPRNTHRCDDRALKNFVFVGQQNAAAQPVHSTVIRCVGAEIEFWIYNRPLPLADICLAMRLERLSHRLEQLGSGALITAAKCHGHAELTIVWKVDFSGQRDIAVKGRLELPVHFEIVHQVLPTIAETDVAYGTPRETAAACHD